MAYETLIVGLGNPGYRYEGSRHNIGFMSIEAFAGKHGLTGKHNSKMQAIVAQGHVGEHGVVIAQPVTFMNRSGDAVIKLKQYYKIELSRLLVVFDDVSIPFGKLRFRTGGSAGSHNGMHSIINMLGSKDFPRLKIGIGSPEANEYDLADFVLSRFKPEEQVQLPKIISFSVEAIEEWLNFGINQAMNSCNNRDILNNSTQ